MSGLCTKCDCPLGAAWARIDGADVCEDCLRRMDAPYKVPPPRWRSRTGDRRAPAGKLRR